MKSIATIAALFLFNMVNSQVIFNLSDSGKRIISSSEMFVSNTYFITDDNSWITTKDALDQPDEVSVSYKYANPKATSIMLIETSMDGKIWQKGPSMILKQGLSSNENKAGTFLKSKDKIFVKFSLLNPEKDTIILTQITIVKIKEEEKKFIDRKDDQADDEKINNLIQKNDITNLKLAVDALSNQYKNMLTEIVELSSSNAKLTILSNLSQFLINRTSMANPTRYSSFNGLLENIKEEAGGLDSLLIVQLNNSVTVDLEKKSGRANGFLNTIYNIGNLISGGRLTNVFASIKQIFARTYAQGNILMNAIQQTSNSAFEPINLKKENKDDQTRNIQVSALVLNNIRNKSAESVIKLKELDEFMQVLDNETSEVDFLLASFKEVGTNLENFDERLFNYLKEDVYPDSKNEFSKSDYEALKVNSPKTFDYLKKAIDDTLNSIKQILDSKNGKNYINESKKNIERLSKRLNGLTKLEEKYFDNANHLYVACYNIKESLIRDNPFRKISSLAKYADEWDGMNLKALTNISSVPDEIKKQYITKVKNTIVDLQ